MKQVGKAPAKKKRRSSAPPSERRKSLRVSVLQDIFFGDGSTRRSNDVSEDGIFVATPAPYMAGSLIDLRFRLVPNGRPISVRGEVRHSSPGVGMGVQFMNLRRQDRTAIRDFVKTVGRLGRRAR